MSFRTRIVGLLGERTGMVSAFRSMNLTLGSAGVKAVERHAQQRRPCCVTVDSHKPGSRPPSAGASGSVVHERLCLVADCNLPDRIAATPRLLYASSSPSHPLP